MKQRKKEKNRKRKDETDPVETVDDVWAETGERVRGEPKLFLG